LHVNLRRRLSVTTQLVLLAALILVPFFAASVWLARKQYDAQREALGQTLLSVARALSSATDRELAVGLAIGETLAQSRLIDQKRFADHHAFTLKAIASRAGTSAALFSPDGQQIYNTARPFGEPLPNVFKRDAAQRPAAPDELPQGGTDYVRRTFETGAPVYSDLFAGQIRGSKLVAVSVPVIRDGEVLYCLSIAFPVASFQPLLEQYPRATGSGAVVFDRRGFIIARAVKPEAFVGKPVPRDTLLAVASASESIGHGTNVQGERFFRAVVRSPVSGWGAGAALSEESAFGTIAGTMRDTAVTAAILMLVGAALAYWMGRTLARRHEAETQSRAKDEFIAALSHELRNPIATIALAVELLKRKVHGDAQAVVVVETLSRQVEQLRGLLQDLLDNTRAMYGKLALVLEAIDLHACVARIAEDYRRRPDVSAEINVSGMRTWVKADPARLHQMVDNLIENAVKYGGRRISIEVEADDRSGVLAVTDDGSGIDPRLLPRLFEPFIQGEQSIERPKGGLGLGLALVKRLALLHGGSVRAQSAGVGKGSRFTLRLPLAEPPVAQPRESQPAAAKKRRVLVVEDSDDARESLRHLLELDGHEVALAADGAEGLRQIESFRPDVALIDIGLPGMNGYELARAARAGAGKHVLLVAVTGYGQSAEREMALKSGFDLHLTKPVSMTDLERAIREAI
jgi:signal transduction histidine kinase